MSKDRNLNNIPWHVLERMAWSNGFVHHDHHRLGSIEKRIIRHREFYYKRINADIRMREINKSASYSNVQVDECNIGNGKVTTGEYGHIELGGRYRSLYFYRYAFVASLYFPHPDDEFDRETVIDRITNHGESIYVLEYDEQIEIKYSEHCYDPEYFDPATGTDLRDGGRVLCYPDVDKYKRIKGYRGRSCRCCSSPNTKSVRKRHQNNMRNIVKIANSNSYDDTLDFYL